MITGSESGGAGVVLGRAQYGKAEVRLLHVDRDGPRHRITDLNVSITLAGDLAETYLTGDNAKVLTTDTQKNTVYAFARQFGVTPVEEFGLRLARHFAGVPSVGRAQVRIEQYGWQRIEAGGEPHPHSFERLAGTRVASVHVSDGGGAEIVAGVDDVVLFAGARAALVETFAATYSRSLQQTLYAMGEAVLAACPGVCEARFSLPNKHHFLVDLAPFGLDNPGEVFYAADRPYGLIEGTVCRPGAPPGEPEHQW